jgi:transposase InsO family protein
MRSSMGQTGNCYDNALVERVNGILKLEYGLDAHFATVAQAREAVVQAIWLYNHERPHNSLEKQTPYIEMTATLKRVANSLKHEYTAPYVAYSSLIHLIRTT